VTIEVVQDPHLEVEMDLAKEKDWLPSSSSSPSSTLDWLGGKKLFWPLFWTYTDSESGVEDIGEEEEEEEEEEEDYSLDGSEEPLPSGVGEDWDSRWNEGWDPMQSYYGESRALQRRLHHDLRDAREGCKRRMQEKDVREGCKRRMQEKDGEIKLLHLSYERRDTDDRYLVLDDCTIRRSPAMPAMRGGASIGPAGHCG